MAELCGAKTRSGGSCRGLAMPNGRCRMHGGPSTGPKTPNSAKNALKHGIYATYLTDEELELSKDIKLGTVEQELVLTRIRLRRALAAEDNAKGEPEILERVKREGGGEYVAAKEEKSRIRDYVGIVDKLTARIESLERTRILLRLELGIDPKDMDAEALTPGTPDEPAPATQVR